MDKALEHDMIATGGGRALLDSFAQVRIINLQTRADRRKEVTHELGRLGLSVDGNHVAFFDAMRFDDAAEFPTSGTRGCFHSHLEVLAAAVKSGAQSVLIFEDDLDFVRDIEVQMTAALDALAATDWSIFYGAVLQWQPDAPRQSPLSQACADDAIMGGHFVAFRGEALRDIVPYLQAMLNRPAGDPGGGPMHVDGAYSWFRKEHPQYHTFVAHPDLGRQRPSRTDIHRLKLKDRIPVIKSLTALARRVYRRL